MHYLCPNCYPLGRATKKFRIYHDGKCTVRATNDNAQYKVLGYTFTDKVKMVVVKPHENEVDWWCQAVDQKERTGLWTYGYGFIVANRVKNAGVV